ncbi:ATP-dependent DNA helicase RecG [Candidatus Gracilibacteria bacterium]|nr:ATP-dependent DNA helicase RecG [Candidatus Gracilibacteria bacterium]
MLSKKLTKSMLKTTDNYISGLLKGGIETVGNLLDQYPREYEDRTNVLDNFSLINIKEKNTILVKLVSINTTKTANNKLLTKAVLEDKNGFLSEAVWFNRKYLASQLKYSGGKKVLVSGKVKYAFGKVTFNSPDVETDLSKVEGEIVPIYSDLNYIPSKWTSGKIELLKSFIGDYTENLPEHIVEKYNFVSKAEAVHKIHFPKNKNDIEIAKKRLGYEELFDINYRAISSKYKKFTDSAGKSLAIELNANFVKEILSKLPFELTNHQKIALFQILKDMEKDHAMQRLLEGDVGTGKTVVSLLAIIHGILETRKQGKGIQVAIMAPTAILATQHFISMQTLLFEYGISTELLVGATTAKQKKEIKQKLVDGNVDVIIGTHALVQDDVLFSNLGLVIIDEQHRFGVKQREVLETGLGNETGLIPHILNMTATPIPRTLALTLYGDQDLSVINEYPKGRKDIFTKVASTEDARHQIELFVRNELEKGRQIFWVSPLVEESEKMDLANAINTYENLVNIFDGFQVGLIHGKMKPKEKDEIMADFKDNKIQVLSATSVIEVGIDIPNASIICIEGAERFGLSQLHQIRGRVGRGQYQSYCYLFPSKGYKTERLQAMERTNNGFELSEIDLELRGPGEVYGLRQSGVPDLKVAELTDLELISQIREDIEEMFEKKEK